MIETAAESRSPASWEDEIRAREELARIAFLGADLAALDELWADSFAVNSPLQRVLTKRQVFEALKSGRIRHLAFEMEIEHLSGHGDVVVVMGKDRVVDLPGGSWLVRRFTNIWKRDGTVWRAIGRHAQVASRDEAR